ncbi:hypothetical protein [Pseudomonas putida]|uniref:hypothetical protein n=1 Tax=Pseudomonas putida TaxID=303 RepID=UPI00031934D3
MCVHHRGRSGFTREYGGGGNSEGGSDRLIEQAGRVAEGGSDRLVELSRVS